MQDPNDTVTMPLNVGTNTPITLRYASKDRLYAMTLTRDLFNQWVLVLAWNGRFSRRGGGKTIPLESFDAGVEKMREITRVRERHGYKQLENG